MILRTGSNSIVCNVWSDAAREASAEARRSAKSGETAGTGKEHTHAFNAHKEMSKFSPEGSEEKALHETAANMHKEANKPNYGKDWIGEKRDFNKSMKAREASDKANSATEARLGPIVKKGKRK